MHDGCKSIHSSQGSPRHGLGLSTYLLSQILKPEEAINVVSIISHNHKKGQFSRLTSYTISNRFKKDTDRCQNCQMVQTLHLNSKEVRKTHWRLEWELFL